MITLRALRRLALGSVAALAILPFTAGAVLAQDAPNPDDLCDLEDEAPESFAPILDAIAPLIDAACEDDGSGDGDDEGEEFTLDDLLDQLDLGALEELLGQLPTEELCALRDEAPEEFAPLLEALEVLTDLVCDADETGDPEPEPEPEPSPEPDPDPEVEQEQVAASTPTLPNTGGGAALAGLALLGAAGAVRRLVSLRS
jgi:hypothetical protein